YDDDAHAHKVHALQPAAFDALNEGWTQALSQIEIPCLDGRGPRRRFDDDAEANTVQIWGAAPVVVIADSLIFLPGNPCLELEGTRAGRRIIADHLLLAGCHRFLRCNMQALRIGHK